MVEVLTASATIDTGEDVAAAQDAGKFEKSQVRREDVVDGALTTTSSISDAGRPGHDLSRVSRSLAAKFGTSSDAESLVIPDDKLAVSVELTDPERVAGFVNPGSDVAIFISADPVLEPPDGTEKTLPPYTRICCSPGSRSSVSAPRASRPRRPPPRRAPRSPSRCRRTILTVAVNQKDAEKLIYAARNSDVSFALLTKNTKSQDQRRRRPRSTSCPRCSEDRSVTAILEPDPAQLAIAADDAARVGRLQHDRGARRTTSRPTRTSSRSSSAPAIDVEDGDRVRQVGPHQPARPRRHPAPASPSTTTS